MSKLTDIRIHTSDGPRTIKAHVRGHEAFAVHPLCQKDREPNGRRDGYVVTHRRTGLLVTIRVFERVDAARDFARGAQRVIDTFGDFGTWGHAKDDGSDTFKRLEAYTIAAYEASAHTQPRLDRYDVAAWFDRAYCLAIPRAA